MMRFLLLFVWLFSILGCSHQFQSRRPASAPRHIVIGVHGIGGDSTTWGDMEKVLIPHLSQIKPKYQHEFYNFTYPTGSKGKTTYYFGEELLSDFIENVVFGARPLQPEDRISFVTHSQGGLVVSIWYINTLVADSLDQEGRYRKDIRRFAKYADQVDTIITLGTPFWGSKLATRFTDPLKFDPTKTFGVFNPLEMNEMAFSSNTVYQLRRSAIALSQRPMLKSRFKARILNISGVFPKDESKLHYQIIEKDNLYKLSKFVLNFIREKFFKIGFGDDRYESDIAVLAPSSRLKFLFAEDLSTQGPIVPIAGNDYKEADFFANSEWVVTESVHSPVVPEYSVGMAYIPKRCVDLNTCRHPTYPYILSALSNCAQDKSCDSKAEKGTRTALQKVNAGDEELNRKLASDLKGFEIEVVLRMPDTNYDIENPKFKSKPGVRFYTQAALSNENDSDDRWIFSQEKFYQECVKMPRDKKGRIRGSSDLAEVYLAKPTEYLSKIVAWREIQFGSSDHKDLRLHLTGSVRPTLKGQAQNKDYQELVQKGVDIPIEFELPGLVKRKATVRVRPGFSTYLELQMRYSDGAPSF